MRDHRYEQPRTEGHDWHPRQTRCLRLIETDRSAAEGKEYKIVMINRLALCALSATSVYFLPFNPHDIFENILLDIILIK